MLRAYGLDQTNVNITGGTVSPNLTIAGNTATLLGDSITAQTYSESASSRYYWTFGWGTWLRIYSDQSLDLPFERVRAVSGYRTDQIISDSDYLDGAVSDASAFTFVMIGTNDYGINTAAVVKANLDTIYAALLNAGSRVVAFTILPRTTVSDAQRDYYADINRYIRNKAATTPGILLVDATPEFVDVSNADGEALSALTYDGLHPTCQGAEILGRLAWNVVSPFVPIVDQRFNNPADLYDSTANTAGNMLTNGLLEGTGGSQGTNVAFGGATDIADNWTVDGSSSGNKGTADAVCTKVARTDGEDGNWQQIVGSGTPTGAYAIQMEKFLAIPSGIAEGDVVEAICEFELDSGHSNIASVALEVFVSGNNVANRDGHRDQTNGSELPAGAISGVFRTPPYTVASGDTHFEVKPQVWCHGGSAIGFTVRFGRVSLRKVG